MSTHPARRPMLRCSALLLALAASQGAAQDGEPAAPPERDLPVAVSRWEVGDTVTWTNHETASQRFRVVLPDGKVVTDQSVVSERDWTAVVRAAEVDAEGRRTRTQVRFTSWRSESALDDGVNEPGEPAVDESLTGVVAALSGGEVTLLTKEPQPTAAAMDWLRDRFPDLPLATDAADSVPHLRVPAAAKVGAVWEPDVAALAAQLERVSPLTVDRAKSEGSCRLRGVTGTGDAAVAEVEVTTRFALSAYHFRSDMSPTPLAEGALAELVSTFRLPLTGRLRPAAGVSATTLAMHAEVHSPFDVESKGEARRTAEIGGEIPGIAELEKAASDGE